VLRRCRHIVAVGVIHNEIAGVRRLCTFDTQSGLKVDTTAQLERVHDVASRDSFLEIVIRGVRGQRGRPLIQRKRIGIRIEIRDDAVKAGNWA
jgi:hypothetical protein